jgi:hypothetical protein
MGKALLFDDAGNPDQRYRPSEDLLQFFKFFIALPAKSRQTFEFKEYSHLGRK